MPVQNDVALSITVAFYKVDDCTFTLDDDRAKKPIKYFGKVHFAIKPQETMLVQRVLSRDVNLKIKVESFGFSDRFVKDATFVKKIKESFNIADYFHSNRVFLLKILESIGFTRILCKNFQKAKMQEQVTFFDGLIKETVVNRNYFIKFVDVLSRDVVAKRLFLEIIDAKDSLINKMLLDRLEVFAVSDNLAKEIVALKSQTIMLEEKLRRDTSFFRLLAERINASSIFAKELKINKNEAILVLDALLQHCNAIISNLSIKNADMDLDKFLKETLKPPLYEPFVEFNVGDYEYQKALVRFVLESRATNAEPLLYAIATHVDIDDVDDRGTVNITDVSDVTKVYFNKFYYHPPEVQVTLRGSSTAANAVVPVLLSTDKTNDRGRYFEVEIRDGGNERVCGIVSWVAKGY